MTKFNEPPIHSIVLPLLPCPFCGGVADVISANAADKAEGRHFGHYACCTQCGVRRPARMGYVEAVKLWNTRANPTPDLLPPSWETLARNIREIIAAEAAKGGSVFNAVDAVVRELTSTGNPTPDSLLVEKLEALDYVGFDSIKTEDGRYCAHIKLADAITIVRQHYAGAAIPPINAGLNSGAATPAPAPTSSAYRVGEYKFDTSDYALMGTHPARRSEIRDNDPLILMTHAFRDSIGWQSKNEDVTQKPAENVAKAMRLVLNAIRPYLSTTKPVTSNDCGGEASDTSSSEALAKSSRPHAGSQSSPQSPLQPVDYSEMKETLDAVSSQLSSVIDERNDLRERLNNAVEMISEADYKYNRMTNALIERTSKRESGGEFKGKTAEEWCDVACRSLKHIPQWQPINTAPKDTPVLGWYKLKSGDSFCVVRFSSELREWRDDAADHQCLEPFKWVHIPTTEDCGRSE